MLAAVSKCTDAKGSFITSFLPFGIFCHDLRDGGRASEQYLQIQSRRLLLQQYTLRNCHRMVGEIDARAFERVTCPLKLAVKVAFTRLTLSKIRLCEHYTTKQTNLVMLNWYEPHVTSYVCVWP